MGSEAPLQVTWARAALNDIAEIDNFIAADNPSAADRVVGRILERTALLATFPKMGRPYVRTRSRLIRSTVVDSYRIFYVLNESVRHIEIVNVRHGARLDPDFETD